MTADERLRIAYLVRPVEGGIKQHLLTLLAGLDRNRFDPVLICPPGSLAEEAARQGCTVISLELSGPVHPIRDLVAAVQLRRILRRLRPDILHLHSAKAGLVGRLALLGSRRPVVLLTVHSFVFDERVGARMRALTSCIERFLLRFTDRILAVSRALKDDLVTEMGLPADRITILYNGIDFAAIAPPQRQAGSGYHVGAIARLAPQKGVDDFIRAAAIVRRRFPAARFTIAGDGPLRGELEALADNLGIADAVTFLGFYSDIPTLLNRFDVFALTSTREAFGITVVEALACETPVVATNVGGISEIIDETTGLLATPRNPEDIAAKICQLLTDPQLARRLARAGSSSVRERFGNDRMLAQLQALYTDLAARRRVPPSTESTDA